MAARVWPSLQELLVAIRDRLAGVLPVQLTGSNAGKSVSASQTRPNDTTAYAVGDVVGQNPAANMTFANVVPDSSAGGTFVVLGGGAIYVSDTDPVGTLLHEAGHLVHQRLLQDDFTEYARVKGYPYGLSRLEQFVLPWELRVAEWFAEDFAEWIDPGYQRTAGPPLTDEMREWFDNLTAQPGGFCMEVRWC